MVFMDGKIPIKINHTDSPMRGWQVWLKINFADGQPHVWFGIAFQAHHVAYLDVWNCVLAFRHVKPS